GDFISDVCAQPHEGCLADGRCGAIPEGSTTSCRVQGTLGPCDAGDVCDGTNTGCPLTGREDLCTATIPDTIRGNRTTVVCQASAETLQGGQSSCTGQGILGGASPAGQALARRRPGAPPAVGTQVVEPRTVPLIQRKGSAERRGVLPLPLNRLGQQLLRKQG